MCCWLRPSLTSSRRHNSTVSPIHMRVTMRKPFHGTGLMTTADLAAEWGLSPQRIWQLIDLLPPEKRPSRIGRS